MAKFRSIKNSFLGGQISPTATGRTDLPQYPHACEILKNMIPLTSGGAYRRPGTLHVDYSYMSGNGAPRMIEFIASRKEAYAIAIYSNVGGTPQMVAYRATGNRTNAYQSSNVAGTPPWKYRTAADSTGTDDEMFELQYTQSVDVMYLTHPNHKPQKLIRSSMDNFSMNDFDFGLTGLDLVHAYPYRNQSATGSTLACSVQTAGSTGVLTLAPVASDNFRFDPKHVGAIFVIDSGSGGVGAVQVTSYTDPTHVNIKVIVTLGGMVAKPAWWESAWSDYRGWPRSVCLYQQRMIFASTYAQPDTLWFSGAQQFGVYPVMSQLAMSKTISGTARVVSYQDSTSPGDGWSTGPAGDDPFTKSLSQSQLDAILWLSPDKELLVGTLSQEWLVSYDSASTGFNVGTAVGVIQSKYGSDWIRPSRIGYELIFVTGSQDEVRAYQYNYIDASFFAEPVQLMFDEYPKAERYGSAPGRRKYRQIAWDVTRQTLWCLDSCGNFFGMTRDRKLQVTSWHTHEFGGFDPDTTHGINPLGSGLTTAADPSYFAPIGGVLSFTIVPNPISGVNDIWLAIKRIYNGQISVSIERMIGKNTVRDTCFEQVYPGVSATEPFFVDNAYTFGDNGDGTLVYNGPVSEGSNTQFVGNYFSPTYGIFKITSGGADGSGNVTINQPLSPDYGTTISNWLVLGQPFSSVVQTTRIDSGSVIGTAQGAIKRITRVIVRLFKTIGAKVGSPPTSEDHNDLEDVNFMDPNAPMGESPEIFTGDKIVGPLSTTYDRSGYVYLRQDEPMPFTVVSIVCEGVEFD